MKSFCRIILVKQKGLLAAFVRKVVGSKFNHIAITDPLDTSGGFETGIVMSLDPLSGVGRYQIPSGWEKRLKSKYRYKSPDYIDNEPLLHLKYSFWHSIKTGIFHWFPFLRRKFGHTVNLKSTNCVGFVVRFFGFPVEWEYDTPEELFKRLDGDLISSQPDSKASHGGHLVLIGV